MHEGNYCRGTCVAGAVVGMTVGGHVGTPVAGGDAGLGTTTGMEGNCDTAGDGRGGTPRELSPTWSCSMGLYSLAERDMRACNGRQPIMQTIMAGKMEMVLPAIYMMNRFIGICFSGASATSQQRCRERGNPGFRDVRETDGRTDGRGPPSYGTQASGSPTIPPMVDPGVRGARGCPSFAPAHLLHEDFVAFVDAALPQLSLGEPQRPAALGGSAGPGGDRKGRGSVRLGRHLDPPNLLTHTQRHTQRHTHTHTSPPGTSPPPRRRRQLQRPLETPSPNRRRCRRHLASARRRKRRAVT